MNIHEYQAKEILSRFGVSIPKGGVAYSPENAKDRATELGGDLWVVKAQIHSGARGKAGGIIVCKSEQEVSDAANKLLGKTLVTHQTGPEGKTVQRIYVEEGTDIKKEFYTENKILRWIRFNPTNFRVLKGEPYTLPETKLRGRCWVIRNHKFWAKHKNEIDMINAHFNKKVETIDMFKGKEDEDELKVPF